MRPLLSDVGDDKVKEFDLCENSVCGDENGHTKLGVMRIIVIEGLVTDPVKLPEPVIVRCAGVSLTLVTYGVPDCVYVAPT
jgi:hypothetical protein